MSNILVSPILFEYLLRLADDSLVHGHRLSEWCRFGPTIEEDLALANIALDCLGQAKMLFEIAAAAEGKGRNADQLCFFRDASDYRNLLLVEIPDQLDFATAIVKQFLFDAYRLELYGELRSSAFLPLAAFSEKALKEVSYHYRHSSSWIVRLGDGTAESHQRIQAALSELWQYTAEFFLEDELAKELHKNLIAPSPTMLQNGWLNRVRPILSQATLEIPLNQAERSGGRAGKHSEALNSMLLEMQSLARAHPDANW